MSDFDTVLERLVTDPGFAAQLSADPAGALAGYRLSADEVDLLRSQVSMGDGGGRSVETRTSKASMMGLLGAIGGVGGPDRGRGGAPPPPQGVRADTPGRSGGHRGGPAAGDPAPPGPVA